MNNVKLHGRKAWNQLRKPESILSILFLIILAYLIIVPLISLICRTFVWGTGDLRIQGENVEPGKFTLYHWRRINWRFRKICFLQTIAQYSYNHCWHRSHHTAYKHSPGISSSAH